MSATAFKALLEDGDVDALRSAWAKVAPHLPQLETREDAEISMHMARTATKNVRFKLRAWSHRWLTERNLPSQLPDDLKPRAERMYPVIASAVGISVNMRNPFMRPVAIEVRKAMEYAVLDAEAEGRLMDSVFVSARMREARERTYKTLTGSLSCSMTASK